jgi:DNA-binding beta-propeller fold protein YncE
LGGVPEAAVSDTKGTLYVGLEDKNAVAVVDAQALKPIKTYPIEHCSRPSSASYDKKHQRLFVGCSDGLAVLDVTNGNVVAHILICSGVDAGDFDPDSSLIFESCGEGVMSVIHEITPDYYELIDTVKTQLWARTVALDTGSKDIFLPTADIKVVAKLQQPTEPFEPEIQPGTFRVLVVKP